MDFFTKKQISKEEIKNYYFHFIVYNIKDNTLSIKLNRPEKKNALHPQMINEIGVLLEYAKYSKYVRIIIFESTGDTFCAGLDLKVINSKIDKIDKIKNGEFDKIDNPIKNAPHTDLELASNEWKHKYSREDAAYPSKFLKSNKFWPPVSRVDNVYGDKNLFCTCPSMDEFKEDAA